MNVVHIFRTDLCDYTIDPRQFAELMTRPAQRVGFGRAATDRRYRVAKAIEAWALEQDSRLVGKLGAQV